MSISVILLAGGKGARMQAAVPKQFLPLKERPIARYSFDVFLELPEVTQIIVVCEETYEPLFQTERKQVLFASPGKERQDSVFNGLQKVCAEATLVCIHDAARPFIKKTVVRQAFQEAEQYGAAAIAVPVKCTVKRSKDSLFVKETLDRSHLWEMQTPQVIQKNLLEEGFAYLHEHGLTVTDDAALVELLNKPVKLVCGDYSNIKITTPDDLIFAEMLHARL